MKRLATIGILCLLYIYATAGYYYYKGEKVPLHINPDSVTVYVQTSANKSGVLQYKSYTINKIEINRLSRENNRNITSVEYIIGDEHPMKMSNCFYIKLKELADTTILQKIVKETNTHLQGEVPYIDNWYTIMVANSTINNSLEMSNYFYETGLFADVDPGFIFEFTPSCVSDATYDSQWALPQMNMCAAWNVTKGNNNVRVAVVDQGIDKSHLEFIGTNFLPSYDCEQFMAIDTIYGDHGTFIAGIISANHNQGEIAGVAPNVSIMPISHSIDGDYMSQELASGIRRAMLHGADIINCSWGDQGGIYYHDFHSALMEYALDEALTAGRDGKGCVVVFGSGNYAESGLPIDYPGNYTPEILVVGATNQSKQRASRSAFGKTLDILAPGDNILSTTLNNMYEVDGGTSYSAAYVSGIAALILSINPDLTREEVTNIIELTAQKVGNLEYEIQDGRPNGKWHEEMGYGLVDAYAAVLAAQPKYIQNQIYQTGEEVYEYAPEITAGYAVTDSEQYGNVICEAGSEVLLRAMDRIRLKPGFHAQSGSKVHIVTDSWTYTPSDPAISASQRIVPRSSSASADDTEQTNKVSTTNALENIESNMIQSTAIYTISGQLLQTIEGGQRDAAHLPNGMYILQHRMSDGSMKSEKITNYK